MATTTPSRAGVSPSSSPRLPSPPPFTEVQFGPKSPSVGGSITELQLEATTKQDDGALRRIRPGSSALDMAKGPPFVPLHQLESPFQLQEYLKSLYHKLTRDEASNTVKPVTKEIAIELATPPTAADTGESVDRNLWLYELCRFLCSRTTRIIVAFFADNPPCSALTCPEMRASEWQYLCAVHEPPKSCCAIDYCNHTLDWASNVLTSQKNFPSRLSLGGESGNAYQSMRQLTNIFRRVYRIYAHAWFQHREVFWTIEGELGLYLFFKTVCDVYQLIPEDNYTIPPEAEGEREDTLQTPVSTSSPQRVAILQKQADPMLPEASSSQINTSVPAGATTRRHKHTPSTGVPVSMIAEGAEDDEEQARTRLRSDILSTSPTKLGSPSRASPPTFIGIPKNTEPERAPEDPTPVAIHGVNPLSLPISPTKPSTIADSTISAEPDSNSATDVTDVTQTSDSNEETQIAIDDSDVNDIDAATATIVSSNDDSTEVGNETMEKIEVPTSTHSNVTLEAETEPETASETATVSSDVKAGETQSTDIKTSTEEADKPEDQATTSTTS